MDKIDPKPGETWLTRDGAKARIYAVDGVGSCHIHGAWRDDIGWRVMAWAANGSFWADRESPYDLSRKQDWREELAPIWAVLKPEYKAIAMNQDGVWFACTETDGAIPENGVWVCSAWFTQLKGLILPTPDCDWTETWTKRPDSE